VHGANRLASNSLLEAVVFGARVAGAIAAKARNPTDALMRDAGSAPGETQADATEILELRRFMQENLGVIRSGAAPGWKADVRKKISGRVMREGLRSKLGDMSLVAHLMMTAALNRKESRGGHFRADHPEPAPVAQWTFMRNAGIDLPDMPSPGMPGLQFWLGPIPARS
jgi:L-aspartate oxidase